MDVVGWNRDVVFVGYDLDWQISNVRIDPYARNPILGDHLCGPCVASAYKTMGACYGPVGSRRYCDLPRDDHLWSDDDRRELGFPESNRARGLKGACLLGWFAVLGIEDLSVKRIDRILGFVFSDLF